ncbi:hypothetical protein [Nonomuraea lactucae]|uniref:hypothetical protein n=1 Tax=Nonomuraea lactucae TaxID=2249762 RepID=UPI000DE52435|nr:hypothetical protein [Nonomuraea lactucae]
MCQDDDYGNWDHGRLWIKDGRPVIATAEVYNHQFAPEAASGYVQRLEPGRLAVIIGSRTGPHSMWNPRACTPILVVNLTHSAGRDLAALLVAMDANATIIGYELEEPPPGLNAEPSEDDVKAPSTPLDALLAMAGVKVKPPYAAWKKGKMRRFLDGKGEHHPTHILVKVTNGRMWWDLDDRARALIGDDMVAWNAKGYRTIRTGCVSRLIEGFSDQLDRLEFRRLPDPPAT